MENLAVVMSDPDRALLIARREALKARLERDRRLELIKPLLDVLNQQGIAFGIEAECNTGGRPAWPIIGTQIDWSSVPGATYIKVTSDADRDIVVRSLISRFSASGKFAEIILPNGDAPIVSLLSCDLAAACGPILSGQISLYIGSTDEGWLIENIEGRGVWGGVYVPGVKDMAVAVGPSGAVYTSDNGATWTAINSLNYWSVGFASPRAGWAVGVGGRITKLSGL